MSRLFNIILCKHTSTILVMKGYDQRACYSRLNRITIILYNENKYTIYLKECLLLHDFSLDS